jgi:hypothetical protein
MCSGFAKDHAQSKTYGVMAVQAELITLWRQMPATIGSQKG